MTLCFINFFGGLVVENQVVLMCASVENDDPFAIPE